MEILKLDFTQEYVESSGEPQDDLHHLQKELEQHLSKAETSIANSGGLTAEYTNSPTPSIEEELPPPTPPPKSDLQEDIDYQEEYLPEIPSQEDYSASQENFDEQEAIVGEEGSEYFGNDTQSEVEEFGEHIDPVDVIEHPGGEEQLENEESYYIQEEIEEPKSTPELYHANEEEEIDHPHMEVSEAHMDDLHHAEIMDNAKMNLVEGTDRFAVEKKESTTLHYTSNEGAGESMLSDFEHEASLNSQEHIDEQKRHMAESLGVAVKEAQSSPSLQPTVKPTPMEPRPTFQEIRRTLEKKEYVCCKLLSVTEIISVGLYVVTSPQRLLYQNYLNSSFWSSLRLI